MWDYDQLDSAAKQVLADLADGETEVAVPSRVAARFDRGGVVKYTRYLRVEV